MRQLRIPLRDIVIDLEMEPDLHQRTSKDALEAVRKAFAFLPDASEVRIDDEDVVIEFPERKPGRIESGQRLHDKGMAAAQQGDYIKAIDLFQRALQDIPDYADARRNLAMAHLEAGHLEKARKHLTELLCLAPNDQWGLLLAANLFSKHLKNRPVAARFYDRAYTLDPTDAYILTSYAALLLEMGKVEEARSMFRESIEAAPSYPNAYLGLVMLLLKQDNPADCITALDSMFAEASESDARSAPIFEEARRVFARANLEVARNPTSQVDDFLAERRAEIEQQSGHRIEVVEDRQLTVTSKSELAWKYGTEAHRVLYRPADRAVIPHFIARAIEHIAMESEARATGQNQKFVSTPSTREVAIRAIGNDIYRLRDMGVPEDSLTEYTMQIVQGIVMQLYNCPLDMVTEYRLHRKYAVIRPHQFASLAQTMADNQKVVESREIKRATPSLIYNASVSMNQAYALFVDELYAGKTAYASAYRGGGNQVSASRLLDLWRNAVEEFGPGDEYRLMAAFAAELRLEGWFEIVPDVTEATLAGYDPPQTDAELLSEREPAILMYLLGALQRFEGMATDEVRSVATEISILGMQGITFTDPDQRHMLKTLPDGEFTGLQLLAMMYAAWRQVDPTVDTGLDFGAVYESALALHRGGGGRS